MFEHSKQTVAGIAAAIAVTLAVGVAAAAGLVPQAGTSGEAAAPPTIGAQTVPDVTEPPAGDATPAETPAATVTAPAAPTSAPAPRRSAGVPKSAPAAPAAAASAPAGAAPTVPARRNPSSAEVMAAMQSLKQRIPMLPLHEGYARDFGNQVCTAFDQGSSFSQVVASAIAAAGKVPFFTLSPADAQFAVRTAVSLFCPGHQAKLA